MLAIALVVVVSLTTVPCTSGSPKVSSPHSVSETVQYGVLLARIERLELRDQQQVERITTLESNMAAMAVVIKEQETEIEALKNRVINVPNIPAPPEDFEDNSTDDPSLDMGPARTVENITKEPGIVKVSEMSRTDARKNVIRTEPGPESVHKIARDIDAGKVAFFARVDVLHVRHLGVNQNILFEHVAVNIGNTYNPHHGVFTAPVSGVYLLSSSVMSGANVEIEAHIALNGNSVARIIAKGTDGRFNQGSQTIVLALKQGDDVSVQNEDADNEIYGSKFCTFSGVLLWSTASSNGVIVG